MKDRISARLPRGFASLIRLIVCVLLALGLTGCIDESGSDDLDSGSAQSVRQESVDLNGQVQVSEVESLLGRFSGALSIDSSVKTIGVYDFNGTLITSVNGPFINGGYEVEVRSTQPVLIKATIQDGTVLWALSSATSQSDPVYVNLQSSYIAALVFASHPGEVASSNVDQLIEKASAALQADSDRLPATVRRIVDNVVLKKLDYSPITETSLEKLRAFGAGLSPVRSLDEVINNPKHELFPHIYGRSWLHPSGKKHLIVTDIEGNRWDNRTSFFGGTAQLDQAPHAVNGGKHLVFFSDKQEALYGPKTLCDFPTTSIYKLALDAPANAEAERLTLDCESNQDPKWSWDEEKIAFSSGPARNSPEFGARAQNIFVMDKDGANRVQLTDDAAGVFNLHPAWSPNNSKIAYVSSRDGGGNIYVMNADGSNTQRLTNGNGVSTSPAFSPDGRQIVFVSNRDGDNEIFIMNVDGTDLKQLTQNSVNDDSPAWAHNSIDLVVSRYRGSLTVVFNGVVENVQSQKLIGFRTITNEIVYDLDDLSFQSIDHPVWAATEHFLAPNFDFVANTAVTPDAVIVETPTEMQNRQGGGGPSQSRYSSSSWEGRDPISMVNQTLRTNDVPSSYSPPIMDWFE